MMAGKTRRKDFDGFHTLPGRKKNWLYDENAVNCDCSGGQLRMGIRASAFTFNGVSVSCPKSAGGIMASYLFKKKLANGEYKEIPVMVNTGGDFFVYNEGQKAFQIEERRLGLTKFVSFIDETHTPIGILISESGVFGYDTDTGLIRTEITEALPYGGIAANRLFVAVAPYTVAYSAPLSPLDFSSNIDDSGKLYLPKDAGTIVDIAVYRDDVYVFFQYGICKITVAGAARDFKVRSLTYVGEKILRGSVGEAGNVLAFLSEDGAYLFDGTKPKRLPYSKALDIGLESYCWHAVSGDRYVARYMTSMGEMRCVVVDSEDESWYFAFDCAGLTQSGEKAIFIYDRTWFILDRTGVLLSKEISRFVVRNEDFGTGGNKGLRKLIFQGSGSFALRVCSKGETQAQSLVFTNGRAEATVGLAGEYFDIEILPTEDCVIRSMRAEYSCAKGGVW